VNSATQSSTGAERAAIVGLVIAVWSASSGMGALQDGLNIAYDVPEDRKFLPKRVIGILMLLLMLLLGVVPASLILFWKPLGTFVNELVPLPWDSLRHPLDRGHRRGGDHQPKCDVRGSLLPRAEAQVPSVAMG